MILFDDGNTELGRMLRETAPEGVVVLDSPGDVSLSAFPSVMVDVPAYTEDRPAFGPDGEFMGMETVTLDAHQELLRMPASWDAVASYIDYVNSRVPQPAAE